MRRVVFPSTAVLVALSWFGLAAQTPAPQPGAPVPGVQVPGLPVPGSPLPPRDPTAAAAETGTAVIRGRVVALESGQPLRRVQVQARSTDAPARARGAFTDELGRFELRELAAGRYTVTATRGGYVTLQYGQRRPFEPGRPIELADGQIVDDVAFTLPPGGVIAGRIVDEYGEPVANAQVRAERYRYVAGERVLTSVASTGSPIGGGTDDRGEFRIFGLPPGDYFVVAEVGFGPGPGAFASDDRTPGYAATYYPGAVAAGGAHTVAVGLGAEVQGVTIPLVVARTATLAGVVVAPEGSPSPRASLSLMERVGGTGMRSRGLGTIGAGGTFSVPGIVPGEYTLQARDPESGATGVASVVVSGADVTGLVVTLAEPAAVRGRVVAAGGAPPDGLRPSDVRIMARVVPQMPGFGAGTAAIDRDWTFQMANARGAAHLQVQTPPGWMLRRILHQGQDVTDTPLDFNRGDIEGITIELTQEVTIVSGSVIDDRGAPSRDYAVVVFADDPARWAAPSRFIGAARPDQDGRFELRNLPPGRYLAVALDYLEEGEETNPNRLARLRQSNVASRLTLAEGQSETLTLRLQEGVP